jgi:outer membrane protease
LIPLRLEYIDQGESRIYIDNVDAKHIYAATISPTYKFGENAYIRVESAYVHADHAFVDKDGNSKNSRICLAAEIGYLF